MALRHTVQRQTVIGLLRDLRGIAQATSSKRTYSEPRYPALVCHLFACHPSYNILQISSRQSSIATCSKYGACWLLNALFLCLTVAML